MVDESRVLDGLYSGQLVQLTFRALDHDRFVVETYEDVGLFVETINLQKLCDSANRTRHRLLFDWSCIHPAPSIEVVYTATCTAVDTSEEPNTPTAQTPSTRETTASAGEGTSSQPLDDATGPSFYCLCDSGLEWDARTGACVGKD